MLTSQQGKTRRFHALVVCLLVASMTVLACFALKASEATAQTGENAAIEAIQPRTYIEDVLDMYYTYECRSHLPSCNIAQYGETYKTIYFQNSFERTGTTFVSSTYATKCAHGGTETRYRCTYRTW